MRMMFGSPLAIVLAARRLSDNRCGNHKPHCSLVYNLFHPTDPIASRIEPLLSARFSILPPINIPHYLNYPLGNGQPYHLLQHRWWGGKRLDFALFCPEGLSNIPAHSLPHLFRASYWESSDVIAFILRQLGRFDSSTLIGSDDKDISTFRPSQPCEKWITHHVGNVKTLKIH